MALTLLAGPANAGKVALLLDRYLEALDREPGLIVPNASDVVVRERELLAKRPALLGGTVGTFDDLFRRLAPPQRTATDAQQRFVLRARGRVDPLNGLSASARSGGFVDALREASASSRPACSSPTRSTATSRALYAAYRARARAARPRRPRAPARRGRDAADHATSTPGTASRSSPTASRT